MKYFSSFKIAIFGVLLVLGASIAYADSEYADIETSGHYMVNDKKIVMTVHDGVLMRIEDVPYSSNQVSLITTMALETGHIYSFSDSSDPETIKKSEEIWELNERWMKDSGYQAWFDKVVKASPQEPFQRFGESSSNSPEPDSELSKLLRDGPDLVTVLPDAETK